MVHVNSRGIERFQKVPISWVALAVASCIARSMNVTMLGETYW